MRRRRCILTMGILGAHVHAMPILLPSTPSSFTYTTLSSQGASCVVTNPTNLLERRIPTPPLLAALGLSQLLSPGVAGRIQLAQLAISLLPRFSKSLPLSLCSCIMIMSNFRYSKLINLLSLDMLLGLLSQRMLGVMIYNLMGKLGV